MGEHERAHEREKRVRDVMHEGIVACEARLSLPEAAHLMTEKHVRALVVTDERCGLCGIIAQSDLVNAALHPTGRDAWKSLTVGDVMTRDVLTVTPDAPLSEAAKLMVANRIHRVVVVADGDTCAPIGVLSMGDLVRDMMGEP